MEVIRGNYLVDEGDVIICESPTYIGALGAFNAYRPKYVGGVPMDSEGMIIEELEKALISKSRS